MAVLAVPYEDFWFHDGPWTEQDYLALPSGGPKIELLDGRLIVSPAARTAHQRLMRRLANLLERQAPEELAVEVELNVRVGPHKIFIPDVVATYKGGGEVLVQDPDDVLLIVEVLSASNRGEEWIAKNRLYAKAGLEWYLLVELDEADEDPTLILWRLDATWHYREVGRAGRGQLLELPEPFGSIDPIELLKRRP